MHAIPGNKGYQMIKLKYTVRSRKKTDCTVPYDHGHYCSSTVRWKQNVSSKPRAIYLQTSLQDFFCLSSSNCTVYSNGFVSSYTEGPHSITSWNQTSNKIHNMDEICSILNLQLVWKKKKEPLAFIKICITTVSS